MIRRTVDWFNRLFPAAGYFASRRWFEYISTYDSGEHLLFMNYGFALPEPAPLAEADRPHRYPIQLYHHVASAVNLGDLDVLEVGCGRGGGADYVMRYLEPRSVTAVDLAANAIAFCRSHYNTPGLVFERADAQNLPYPNASFDAVLNVESSICYPDPPAFFREVVRVLRPGGYFLYADLRSQNEIPEWEAQLAELPLECLEQEDLTPGVLQALDHDHARRDRLIAVHVPRLLRATFREFAGLKGTQFFYGALANGQKEYRRYLFRKPLTRGSG